MSDEPPAIRASDAEREQAVARLREAAVQGRLTLDEFAQRAGLAYEMRTHAELEALANDLPEQRVELALPKRRRAHRFTIAVFSGADRKGRWRIALRHWVLSLFGGSDLDLREATLEGDRATIYVLDLFGGTDIYVPAEIEVDFHGFGLFGSANEHGCEPSPRPGDPFVRVVALAIFGGTDLWRVPQGSRGSRRELRRAAQMSEQR